MARLTDEELDNALRKAFAAKLDEPKVVPLPQRRARPKSWIPMALAASIAVAIGWNAVMRWQPSTVAKLDDALIQQPLETKASGEPQVVAATEIMPTASFVTAQGRFCREFEASSHGEKTRGIACRDEQHHWATQVAEREPKSAPQNAPDEFQPASGETTDLAARLGPVTRLTPNEEQSLIQNRWGEQKN